ncbi:MAG TPA: TolC family protein [Vicinamibacterales bacterium]|nr:TolC family protein [Vicinamibacterales bacterium]
MCLWSTSGLVAQSQAPSVTEPLTLQSAFDRALTANPTIAAARLRRAVNQAGITVAGERLNPEVHTEFEKETPKQSFGLAFPLELGGKRGRRSALAEATLELGEAELAQTIIDIRTQVRRAYFGRLIADTRVAVLDELRQFATRARDAAQARFDVGSAPRLELLQGQLALAQAENEATAAQGTARAATIQLNALLGVALDTPVTLATGLDTPDILAGGAALVRAQTSNAELAVLDRQIAVQTAKLALARALRTPDITPDVTLTRDSAPEFMYGWRVAAAATIPIFTTHRAGVQLEEAALTQLNAQRMAVLARITGEVLSASAQADAQRTAYLRYQNEILPQAQQVEQMAEDSYRLGQTGIASLLQALQASRDMRLRSLQTASDFQDALSGLERAIGAPLP